MQAPDGRFVDIDGAWELGQGRWGDLYPVYAGTDREDVLELIWQSCDHVNVRAALPFAKIVLGRLDPDLTEVRLPA